MREFFVLLVAMTIMASTATLVTAHPSSGFELRRLLWRKLVSARRAPNVRQIQSLRLVFVFPLGFLVATSAIEFYSV
jgi:hypothetical protein